MDDPTTGDQIRALRLRAGLTQAELARRVGTTQSAIARWERGAVSPSLRTGRRLAAACGHDLAFVTEGAAEPEAATLDDGQRARIEANLLLTPAQRLDRATRAANFVLRGRQSMSAARR